MSVRGASGAITLREARLRLGASQTALSRWSGISERTIRALENGQVTSPHAATLLALAVALDMPPHEAEAFIRAWHGFGELRSYATVMHTDPDVPPSSMQEGLMRSFLDKRILVASRCIRVGRNRMSHSETYENTVEALCDGVDSHLVMARGAASWEDMNLLAFDECSGCTVRSRTFDSHSRTLAVELSLGQSLRKGEVKTFTWRETNGWATVDSTTEQQPARPDTRYVNRFLRPMLFLSIRAVFEGPTPHRIRKIEPAPPTTTPAQNLTIDQFGTVGATWQNVRPGRYGIEWEWPN